MVKIYQSKKQLKTKLKKLNPWIDITKIKVSSINKSNDAVRIESIDENYYTGFDYVTYNIVKSNTMLNNIVPDLNLRHEKVLTYDLPFNEEILNIKDEILKDPKFNKSPEQMIDFINYLNEIVKYKASQKSINYFKKIEENNDNFKNFEDLHKQFYNYHSLKAYKIDLKSFFEIISNYWTNENKAKDEKNKINVKQEIDKIKREMCRFYNILAQVYGKNNILKMLGKIELDKQLTEKSENNSVVGEDWTYNHCNKVCNSKIIFDTDIFENGWKYAMIVITHEYGHILDYFISNLGKKFDTTEYMISSLANETKINNESYQKILAYGIVRSNYGRTSSGRELFAEAFGRWIMTPEINRDLGWEKLDKFFRIDLPRKL